ncbi:kinase [Dokdonella sp.]|uniref:kinase n=1 Tax=Dokdonella sp. TaxID=2291710 RepID=UPI00378403F6
MRRDANTQFAANVVEHTLDVVHGWIPRHRKRPLCIGVSGLQGSGKSTLVRQLARRARSRGLRCEVLSLDDFYLGRRERLRLAQAVHPLFATRGVPGTHDVALLLRVLAGLARASPARPVRVPRFDKGRDTRLPPSRWRAVTRAPALVLLEGWCVGVAPQSSAPLARPVNALERDEDADGRWRRYVNDELAGSCARAWRRLDRLVLLQAPRFDVVAHWRGEQERRLRRRGAPRAMDGAALRRFLMHYERLSRHALRTLPARADLRLVLDARRTVRAITAR